MKFLCGHHNFSIKRMTFQYLSLVHASIDETLNTKIYVLRYSCIPLIFTFQIKKRQIDHIRDITKRHGFWRVTFSADFTSSKFLNFTTLSYTISKFKCFYFRSQDIKYWFWSICISRSPPARWSRVIARWFWDGLDAETWDLNNLHLRLSQTITSSTFSRIFLFTYSR